MDEIKSGGAGITANNGRCGTRKNKIQHIGYHPTYLKLICFGISERYVLLYSSPLLLFLMIIRCTWETGYRIFNANGDGERFAGHASNAKSFGERKTRSFTGTFLSFLLLLSFL